MVGFIEGEIVEIGDNYLVVKTVSGLGYKVFYTKALAEGSTVGVGDNVTLFVSHQFRENDQSLYGFESPEERNFFELLISVSGVGPKLAATLLSSTEHRDLAQMIVNEDIAGIVKTPGIGKKMAERLIVELRDKIFGVEKGKSISGKAADHSEELGLISQALLTLGFVRSEVNKMLKDGEKLIDEGMSVDDVLRKLLAG